MSASVMYDSDVYMNHLHSLLKIVFFVYSMKLLPKLFMHMRCIDNEIYCSYYSLDYNKVLYFMLDIYLDSSHSYKFCECIVVKCMQAYEVNAN